MHTRQWQAVCGFVTDVCESVAGSGRTMRDLFDLITEDKNKVIYSWNENGHPVYIRRDAFRRSVISTARRLKDLLPDAHGFVGLHLENGPFWPVCYWAVLMSGHTPVILDSRHELFHYRNLHECGGIYCITKERNYPYVIAPADLQGSHSEVDSAFFDKLWADETVFVDGKEDGTLRAVAHDGLSFSEQFLRLREVYRYNQSMFYPPQAGPAKVSAALPFAGFFGLLCGVVLYPCFDYEVYIPDPQEDIRRYLASGRSLSVTHHCVSGERCGEMLSAAVRQIESSFPKDSARLISWLRGEERINDYRTLSRFMAMTVKLRKNIFGKRIRCMICADDSMDGTASRFFNQLGVFFGRGCCLTELGLVSMEVSCDSETRTKNSAGILLKGVVGMLMDDGKLVLDCGENVGKRVTTDGRQAFPSPFPMEQKASFDQHNRLCIIRREPEDKQKNEPADAETILKMRELYAAVLNKPLEIIEEDMDFFSALGGDSLSYFLLLQHIEVLFGIRIKPEERIYFSTARYAAETLKPYIQNKGEVTHNA